MPLSFSATPRQDPDGSVGWYVVASDQAKNYTEAFGPFTQTAADICLRLAQQTQKTVEQEDAQSISQHLQGLQAQVQAVLGKATPQPSNASDLAEELKKLDWTATKWDDAL